MSAPDERDANPLASPAPGLPPSLCGTCAHVRLITSSKGSTFLLCGLAGRQAGFAKYPPQPVLLCRGYQR